jgi:hypothetical protein
VIVPVVEATKPIPVKIMKMDVEPPKVEAPAPVVPEVKAEVPVVVPPKVEVPVVEPPKVETPKVEPPKVEEPVIIPPRVPTPVIEIDHSAPKDILLPYSDPNQEFKQPFEPVH